MLGCLTAAEERNCAVGKETKDLETIKKTLEGEENRTFWDRQSDLCDNRVEGTGTWLLESATVSRWSDPRATSANILALRAPSGHGKSVLASTVIQSLQQRCQTDSRSSVIYYYVQKGSGDKFSLCNRTFKTVMSQLAHTLGGEYLRLVARACEDKIDSRRTADVWRALVTASSLHSREYPRVRDEPTDSLHFYSGSCPVLRCHRFHRSRRTRTACASV